MPKLPLFPKDDPLNQEAVAALRELFANPCSNEASSFDINHWLLRHAEAAGFLPCGECPVTADSNSH
jgi:hypothetical protein